MTRKFLFVIIAILLGIFIFMSEEKTFTPTVIQDIPLPGTEPVANSVSAGYSNTTKAGAPSNISNAPFKQKAVSQETIASSLNTKSKKIQGEYTFTQQGAIKVGEYQNGVSGEMKLSPAGITAKNKSGNTTFAIDGETGDAVFQGEVRAGDVSVVDENGLVSLSAFDSDSAVDNSTEDILTSSISGNNNMNNMIVTLPDYGRPVNILILFSMRHTLITATPSGTLEGVNFFLTIDGASLPGSGTNIETRWNEDNSTITDNSTIHTMQQVGSGEHIIRVMYSRSGSSFIGTLRLTSRTLSVLVLGR